MHRLGTPNWLSYVATLSGQCVLLTYACQVTDKSEEFRFITYVFRS